MKQTLHILILMVAAIVTGCAGERRQPDGRVAKARDTLYTQQAAMAVYAYQPERALQIVDSAVVVGNLSAVWADLLRARIYGQTQMGERLDSLLGGPVGVHLDTARAIAERLLLHDSVKANHQLRQNVLEELVSTARMQQDSLCWLQRSRELVEECRQQGKETKALRTEAEIGASLCFSGQMEEGMAMLDRVIASLSEESRVKSEEFATALDSCTKGTAVANSSLFTLHSSFKFSELDALIIALKRKISVLASFGREEETLPLARRLAELLDDYEQHPDRYYDGSYREPQDDAERADYIRFYRIQAEEFTIAAYAALGDQGTMAGAYEKIERIVRHATAREHVARYSALQQQMETERQQERANQIRLQAIGFSVIALLAIAFAAYALHMSRKTRRKNRVLVREITDALEYKERYEAASEELRVKSEERRVKSEESAAAIPSAEGTAVANSSLFTHHSSLITPHSSLITLHSSLSESELFQQLDRIIRHERLFLSPTFGRQTLADRFHLSDQRIGAAFAQGSSYRSLTVYIRSLRVEHACRLLAEHPEMTVARVGAASGFSSTSVFCRSFKEHIQMTPSEFQRLNVADKS